MRLIRRLHLTIATLIIPTIAVAELNAQAHTHSCGGIHLEGDEPESLTAWDTSPISPTEFDAMSERMHAERLAHGDWIELLGSNYSIRGQDSAILYLLNGFAKPIRFDVVAVSDQGHEYPLGAFNINPRSHVELDLREALAETDGSFDSGSLRATFFGDLRMAQAWIAQSQGTAVVEVPFQPVATEHGSNDGPVFSYWDLDALGSRDGELRFHVINVGDTQLSYNVAYSDGRERLYSATRALTPMSREALPHFPGTLPRTGFIEIQSAPGNPTPALVGFLESRGALMRLPVFQLGDGSVDKEFFSMEANLHAATEAAAAGMEPEIVRVALFNPNPQEQLVHVEVLHPDSGSIMAEIPITVGTMDVVSLDLTRELASKMTGPVPTHMRMRIFGDSPLPPPLATVADGRATVRPVDFLPSTFIHPGGRYLIPDLDANTVWTTIVNLGTEPAEVAGQLFWEGGTYALESFRIDPGRTATLDFQEIVANAKPDLLGRTPTGKLRSAYFHWLLRAGSPALMGRTYVRPNGRASAFGMRCIDCCSQRPVGITVPGSVDFLLNQQPSFVSSVKYITCDGPLGPWPTSPDIISSPSPFNWNAVRVGASGAAKDILSFRATELEIDFSCIERERSFLGLGNAKTCRHLLRKSHDLSKFWKMTEACDQQVGDRPAGQKCSSCKECCSKGLAFNLCNGKNADLAQAEYNACVYSCEIGPCL